MSIRSVDVPVLVQRSTEVDRVQQQRDQQSQVAHQQFALEMRSQQERREIQVREAPKSEKGRIDPDEKHERSRDNTSGERGQGRGTGSNPAVAGQDDSIPKSQASTGHRIDIRI